MSKTDAPVDLQQTHNAQERPRAVVGAVLLKRPCELYSLQLLAKISGEAAMCLGEIGMMKSSPL